MVSSEALAALKVGLPPNRFAVRGTEEYEKLNSSYLSGFESDLKPSTIFLPRSKDEVVAFLSTLKPFLRHEKFAIRSAGNQPLPGCANIQDGITVDLRLLTGIDIKDGFVRIAAGEKIGAVYEKVTAAGLGTSGSRSANGGIGGLALEGGLSFFSTREGFICDNVLNYEIVLASGMIVNANKDENKSLWLALRGGGNNFGVVVSYDMKTFPQEKFWGGKLFYFYDSFPGQIDALVNELNKPDASPETHLMISTGYSALFGGQIMCLNQPYYLRAVENPPVLDPFTKIPQIDAMNTMRLQTLKEAGEEQAGDTQSQVRCVYMNITIKADAATLKKATDIYTSHLDPVKPVEEGLFSFTLQPYPLSLLQKSEENGGNSLGLKPSDGPLVSILLLSYWKNKTDDDTVIKFKKTVLEQIKAVASENGTLIPYVYMNYAFNHQDPIASYGVANKTKLQEVSKEYDPEGIFQTSVPGGFKLFT